MTTEVVASALLKKVVNTFLVFLGCAIALIIAFCVAQLVFYARQHPPLPPQTRLANERRTQAARVLFFATELFANDTHVFTTDEQLKTELNASLFELLEVHKKLVYGSEEDGVPRQAGVDAAQSKLLFEEPCFIPQTDKCHGLDNLIYQLRL
jgi:hypothetical protein